MRSWRLAIATSAALLAACATGPTPGHRSQLTRLWAQYEQLSPQRALAVAGDPELVWVGAATGGHESREAAERAALAECQRRRVKSRMQVPCRLYAVGDEVVWRRPSR